VIFFDLNDYSDAQRCRDARRASRDKMALKRNAQRDARRASLQRCASHLAPSIILIPQIPKITAQTAAAAINHLNPSNPKNHSSDSGGGHQSS
jgi:hypothetical protein